MPVAEISAEEDLAYVPEKVLIALKEKLAEDKKDLKPLIETIIDPFSVPDEDMMFPVDMRGAGKEFESVEDLIEELGTVGTAEALLKARAYFLENKDKTPEDERAKPMTASAFRDALMAMQGGIGEECAEEELLMEDEEELNPEAADEDAEAPPAKKAKTA